VSQARDRVADPVDDRVVHRRDGDAFAVPTLRDNRAPGVGDEGVAVAHPTAVVVAELRRSEHVALGLDGSGA